MDFNGIPHLWIKLSHILKDKVLNVCQVASFQLTQEARGNPARVLLVKCYDSIRLKKNNLYSDPPTDRKAGKLENIQEK